MILPGAKDQFNFPPDGEDFQDWFPVSSNICVSYKVLSVNGRDSVQIYGDGECSALEILPSTRNFPVGPCIYCIDVKIYYTPLRAGAHLRRPRHPFESVGLKSLTIPDCPASIRGFLRSF